MPHPPRIVTAFGRTQGLPEWSRETGLCVRTICSRLDKLQWTPERALSERPNPKFRRGGRPRSDIPRAVPLLKRGTDGRAFSRWRAMGRNHHRTWGDWGSAEAVAHYRQFAAEWAAGSYETRLPLVGGEALSVAGLVIRWIEWVSTEYRKEGRETSEVAVCKAAAVELVKLYGATPAAQFGPTQYRTVRAQWVAAGKSRKTANGYAYRVERAFQWGVGQSLIPPAVHQALRAVEHLRAGRTDAPECQPVVHVADDVVLRTLAALSGPRGAAIRAGATVQRLTGMRPQHLCAMRLRDLDRTGAVWVYTPPPSGNKTYHLGLAPRFYFGPRAQAALTPLLDGCGPDDLVFAWRYTDRTGNLIAQRRPISRGAYSTAIRLACRAAGVPYWHPHQLRHSLATEVAARTGSIEHAAAAIGDTVEMAAAVYVHLDPKEALRRQIAKEHG